MDTWAVMTTIPAIHSGSILGLVSVAADHLHYILGKDNDLPPPLLFTELDTLRHNGEELEWKESAR